MPHRQKLIDVFEEVRQLLSLPDNDYSYSSWVDAPDALEEIDSILTRLRAGTPFNPYAMVVVFLPTGPMQEVSLSSGWGDEFVALADRFDAALEEKTCAPETASPDGLSPAKGCFADPPAYLVLLSELGLDPHLAEVSVHLCEECGQRWLRYFYENEAFSDSGRWYLGPLTEEQHAALTLQNARETLEALDRYYYGGSYFEGKTGWAMGKIFLSP